MKKKYISDDPLPKRIFSVMIKKPSTGKLRHLHLLRGLAFSAAVLTVIFATFPAFSQRSDLRILVLGSARGELSDIEDRILREEVMRQLAKSGRNIVSVMELEKEIQENAFDARQVSASDLKSAAERLNADLIVSGSFSKSRQSFFYQLVLRNIKSGQIAQKEIQLEIKSTPGDYWQKLANGISKEILNVTDPRAKTEQNSR
jgi:hypothetical protein